MSSNTYQTPKKKLLTVTREYILSHIRSILILSSYLHLSIPNSLFPASFLTHFARISPPPLYATCPAHLFLLDHPNNIC
jgi:hypothetical protein